MIEKSITIPNRKGLHARAAEKVVRLANQYSSQCQFSLNNKTADARSIMSLIMLAAKQGTEITISCEGDDETIAMEHICKLINNKFHEDQ